MALYPNGRAPASALISIYGCVASPDMARRVRYVKEEYDRTHPDKLLINEIYRTYAEQVYQKERWTNLGQPGNAATPGFSKHGAWDIGAVDWSCWNVDDRREIAARVGLIHDIPNESWHASAVGAILIDLANYDTPTVIKKRKKNSMYIYWAGGVSYLATGNGSIALNDVALNIFQRLIRSNQDDFKPADFSAAEGHLINEYQRNGTQMSDKDLNALSAVITAERQ